MEGFLSNCRLCGMQYRGTWWYKILLGMVQTDDAEVSIKQKGM